MRSPVYGTCMNPICGMDGLCSTCEANQYVDELWWEYNRLREALRKPVCSVCQAALDDLPKEQGDG